ncbi:MAG: hypothetical protein LUC34_01165, partial [Campylobacter sp.]|nr:hypothetical protein [Campylobacter sp.]
GDVIGMPNSSSSSSSSAGTPNTDTDFPANSAAHKTAIQAMNGSTWASCIYHHCLSNTKYQFGTSTQAYNNQCKQAIATSKKYINDAGSATANQQKLQQFLNLCPFDNRYEQNAQSGLRIEKYDGKYGYGKDSDKWFDFGKNKY